MLEDPLAAVGQSASIVDHEVASDDHLAISSVCAAQQPHLTSRHAQAHCRFEERANVLALDSSRIEYARSES